MARRRSFPQPSLFPFVSVLIGVIGTLSLLISAAGLTSSFENAADMVRTGDPILGELGQARRELETVQAQQDYYADQLDEIRAAGEQSERTMAEQRIVADMLVAALVEEDSLRSELADLEHRLQERDGALVTTGRRVTVDQRWQGQHDLQPIFIECRKGEVEILATGKVIPEDDIASAETLELLLAKLARSEKWCVFLLVRRGGVGVFDKLHARSLGVVPLGYQPILGRGHLDVTDWPRPDWLD